MLTALAIVAAILGIYAVAKSVAFEMRKGRATNVDWSTPETLAVVPAHTEHKRH